MTAFVTATPLVSAAATNTAPSKAICSKRTTVHMGPWKKGEKDEAFQQQQEILQRRRNKQKNSEHFEEVRKRRQAIEEYYDQRRLKVPVGEDPIIAWQKLKDDGMLDESVYTEFDEGGIPIPMASFGIPKYDNGGRFDLRLPHVEIGFTDDDADVMGKAGKAFKNLFGFGRKEEKQKQTDQDVDDNEKDS